MPKNQPQPGPTLEERQLVDNISDLRVECDDLFLRVQEASQLPLADRTSEEFKEVKKHLMGARHWLGECYALLPTDFKPSDKSGSPNSKTKAIDV